MDNASDEQRLLEEESLEIADKVRTGEYFREAKSMYDLAVHDPMAERYLYVLISILAIFTFLIAYVGIRGIHPLQTDIPFAVESSDLVNEMPRIKSLLDYKGENPNEALLRFLVRNYVNAYEEYSIETFDRNVGTIKSQSAEDVYSAYQAIIDPNNPDSPLALYQRHSKRIITIISSTPSGEDDNDMEVIFEATVQSKTEIKRTRWQANITFNYKGIALDEKEGTVMPYEFMVTRYRNKRLQDAQ